MLKERPGSTTDGTTERSSTAADGGSAQPCGLRKAAIFVLSLEESVASELLQTLDDDELERLTSEIASLGVVEQSALSTVLEEFHDLTQLHGVLKEGGLDQAIRLVERSFPPERSRKLTQLLEAHRTQLPLAFLSKAETDSLLVFLEGEHPQTVAAVLAHMAPYKAAEVLERMGEHRKKDLVRRIASLQGTHEEVIRELEKSLRKYLDSSDLAPASGQRDGAQTAADILRAAGQTGRCFLDEMRTEEPDLVDEIYERLFVLEDLPRLDSRSTGRLLEEVGPRCLATALNTAAPKLREKVLDGLSPDVKALVDEEMALLGAAREADVEAARQTVIEAVLHLEEGGEVYVEGRGPRKDRLNY